MGGSADQAEGHPRERCLNDFASELNYLGPLAVGRPGMSGKREKVKLTLSYDPHVAQDS